MSLINDALKRASNTRPERPAEAHSAPPLQPIEESSQKAGPLPLILCITGVGALLVSGAFWLKSKGTAAEALPPQKVAALQEPAPIRKVESQPTAAAAINTPAPANVTPTAPAPAQLAAVEQPQAPVISATPPAPQETVVEATPEPGKPEFVAAASTKPPVTHATANGNHSASAPKQSGTPKLQAIYYRLKGPTVMINGKTLKQGESVDGIKVIAIERNGVDVDVNGARQRLTLR